MLKEKGFGLGGVQTVLLSLLRGRATHAYDIAKEVKRLSGDTLPFHYGTLYPALYKMEREGLVASTVEQPEGERSRRIYRLTDRGVAMAEEARAAWNDYSQAMDRIVNRDPA